MKFKTPELEAEYAEHKKLNSDPYGLGIIRFTERWAALMEAKLAEGAKLEDIAETSSRKADNEGITGFMYECAVRALSHFWEHGEALRVWHNKKHGVPETAKGVVNPALLTIEG